MTEMAHLRRPAEWWGWGDRRGYVVVGAIGEIFGEYREARIEGNSPMAGRSSSRSWRPRRAAGVLAGRLPSGR